MGMPAGVWAVQINMSK